MHPIKRLRARRGLSIRDLEAISGVPKGTISGIERGIRDPQARTLAKLAEGLGVDVGELDPKKAPAPQQSGRRKAAPLASLDSRRLADPEVQKAALASLATYDDVTFATVAAEMEAAIEAERIRRERSA